MKKNTLDQDEKIYKAFQTLVANCVDSIGFPKKPTLKQLNKAVDALNKYERYLKAKEILKSWKQ